MPNFEAFHRGHFIKHKPLISEECNRLHDSSKFIFVYSYAYKPNIFWLGSRAAIAIKEILFLGSSPALWESSKMINGAKALHFCQ